MMDKKEILSNTYGLAHLAVLVKDVERTLQFYQHVFGMEIMYHQEKMVQPIYFLRIPMVISLRFGLNLNQ